MSVYGFFGTFRPFWAHIAHDSVQKYKKYFYKHMLMSPVGVSFLHQWDRICILVHVKVYLDIFLVL